MKADKIFEMLKDRNVVGEDDKDRFLSVYRWAKRGIVGLAAAATLWSGFYTVPTNSKAVVTRFGEYVETKDSGLHGKIPFIEYVTKVETDKVSTAAFGFRAKQPGINSTYVGMEEIDNGKADQSDLENLVTEAGYEVKKEDLKATAKKVLLSEYRVLTGDLNMVDVEWVCQYKVRDPKAFLFNIKDGKETLRDANLSVMKALMGNGSVDEACSLGRSEYEAEAKRLVQKIMDEYGSGLEIVQIQLQNTLPPLRVRDAYNSVNKAQQQMEQKINEARKAYNEVVPKEKGVAQATINVAEGYATQTVNNALGDVARFEEQRKAYQRSPELTKTRMWYDAIGEALPQTDLTIMEQKGAEGGVLNKFDINR